MRLYVNLIPALGYAVVTMFSNMAGWTGEVGKSTLPQQQVAPICTSKKAERQTGFVTVAKDGQVILSNGHQGSNLVWRIPSTADQQWPISVQG